MTTQDLFNLADLCIEAGYFPRLSGQRFVLGLQTAGGGRAVVRRGLPFFALHCPCRVWLLRGGRGYLLGDSFALPGDLSAGVRPPFTG